MFIHKISFSLILVLSVSATAQTNVMQSLLLSFGMIQDPHIQICPENTSIDSYSSDSKLWAQAQAATGLYNKCIAAKYYRSLIVGHPKSRFYQEAQRVYIQTFLKAQDYIMAINEGNKYLEVNHGKKDSEYIHLLVLRGVQGEIRQSSSASEKQTEFVAYSLGIDLEQNAETPLLLNLKYRSFLDQYPESIYQAEVLEMMNESRQLYGQKILRDARAEILKINYPEAFVKYNIILKWGPVVEVFGEAIYEMIKYHNELAWIISDKNLLSDYKLNQFLKKDLHNTISLEERKILSRQTKEKADAYLLQMKTNWPNSVWTQKAMSL